MSSSLYPGILHTIMVWAQFASPKPTVAMLLGYARTVNRESAGYMLSGIAPALAIDRAAMSTQNTSKSANP